MLLSTTIIVKKQDSQFEDLGIASEEIKQYQAQFPVERIMFHHACDFELNDGEIVEGCAIYFDDGMIISVLEDFTTIEQLREKVYTKQE